MTKISTRIDLPGADAHWVIDVETHVDDLFMVCFEQYEHKGSESKRTICTEQLLDRKELERLRNNINNILGDAL